MIKMGMINKYTEGLSVDSFVSVQKHAIFTQRIKHLRAGYKVSSPINVRFGYDSDDFARNLVSVAITYFVLKIPRIASKYLLRDFNSKLLRARNRKYR